MRVAFGEEERSQRLSHTAVALGVCRVVKQSDFRDDDGGAYRFRRGRGNSNSGRMRLTSLKRATYKLKNNDNTVLAAA